MQTQELKIYRVLALIIFSAIFASFVACTTTSERTPATDPSVTDEKVTQTNHKPIKDLEVFNELAGSAKIFGFGDQGVHEQSVFRNRLFKYLVQNHGYRVFIAETELIESRKVDNYIRGKGPLRESNEIIEWMKEYNRSHPKDQIRYVGFDFSAAGAAPVTALEALIPYLNKVDVRLEATVLTLLPAAQKASTVKGPTAVGWDHMSEGQQKELRVGIEGVIETFIKNRTRYITAGDFDSYEWNANLAVVALQMVRNLESRKQPAHVGQENRERAFAENVVWAHKTYGKTFVPTSSSRKLSSKSENTLITELLGPGYVFVLSPDESDRNREPAFVDLILISPGQ